MLINFLAILAIFDMSSSSAMRTFMVTGATSGIGYHTAKKIATNVDNCRLLVHGRRSDSDATSIVEELTALGASEVKYFQADLSDLDAVSALVNDITDYIADSTLDVLINNAGEFDPEETVSKQGFETTYAVNVLAPYVLTSKLAPLLLRSSSSGNSPRLITTSSISQSSRLPSLSTLGKPKDPHTSYSESKLCDRMMIVKCAALMPGVKCLTMDPGTVNTKMLIKGWGRCGIEIKDANNTYKLAAMKEGEDAESGSYHYGGRGSQDAEDMEKCDDLWALLQSQTKVSF